MSHTAVQVARGAGAPIERGRSASDIIDGLKMTPKHISPKYFYDRRGSELFDRICELPEYYLTRAEQEIMTRHLGEIAQRIGPRAAVIELGAGSIAKARQLLARLESPAAYVPVDISGEYLHEQLRRLAADFPGLSIRPVVTDFTRPFGLPEHPITPERNLVFFPGSTVGNFSATQAKDLLGVMLAEARSGGALLIGVDLIKDEGTLLRAYNDGTGITAAFNLNALVHINKVCGANFHIDRFRHEAVYDHGVKRIEMRLVSMRHQIVHVCGEPIVLTDGEHIVTEYSHKYSIEGFAELAGSTGWKHEAVWIDADGLFSVHYLVAP